MATKFRDFGRSYAGQRFGPAVLGQIRPLLASGRARHRDGVHRLASATGSRRVRTRVDRQAGHRRRRRVAPAPDVIDQATDALDWLRNRL